MRSFRRREIKNNFKATCENLIIEISRQKYISMSALFILIKCFNSYHIYIFNGIKETDSNFLFKITLTTFLIQPSK